MDGAMFYAMLKICRCSFLTALLLLSASVASADIYRYVAPDGTIHFTNTPTTPQFEVYRTIDAYGSMRDLINHYAVKFSLDPALVKAVIKAESGFDPNAVSRKGALGLMQLMPQTAQELRVSDPMEPASNIRGGCHYLRKMLNMFDNNLELALAAYNAGPTAVRRFNGIPPYNETRNYVIRVKNYLDYFRRNRDA